MAGDFMSDETKPACERCRFWKAGDCVRFPPRVISQTWSSDDGKSVESSAMTTWPKTFKHDWCGEFSISKPGAEMFLFAFQPEGHGEKSFFVMAESEASAEVSVGEYLTRNPGPIGPGLQSDYYRVTKLGAGEVIENDND